MPSKSEQQRKFMGAVLSYKEGRMPDASNQVKKAAEGMSKKEILDFIKEDDVFVGESEKNLMELEQMYCGAEEMVDEDEEKKYGRGKLFNIPAMMEIINKSNFLKGQYDKMKESGKEIFGYHYNEIILSFIFIKYVKSDEKLYNKYLQLRDMAIKNKELEASKTPESTENTEQKPVVTNPEPKTEEEPKEELEETTGSGSSGAFASPVAFAKNTKNWRFGNQPAIPGGTVVQPNTNKHVQGVNAYKLKTIKEEKTHKYHDLFKKDIKKEYNKFLNPDMLLESLNDDVLSHNITPLNIIVTSVNGKKLGEAIKMNPSTLDVMFSVDKDDNLQDYDIKLSLDQYLNYVLENYSEYKESNNILRQEGLKSAIREILKDTINGTIEKTLENYIIDNFNKATPIEEMEQQHTSMDEDHIQSRNNITEFILDKTNEYTEEYLDSLTYDDLYKLYMDVESEIGFDIPKNDGEQQTEPEEREVLEISQELDEIFGKAKEDIKNALATEVGTSLNEDSKPAALTQLERLKNTNKDNEEDYFKTLNPGVQAEIKDEGKEGGKFEYDYDKDLMTKDEKAASKYTNSDVINDFIDMNRGRGLQDLDFDIQPTEQWLAKFKENLGEEGFKKFLKKVQLRKLERRNMRDVEIDGHDHQDKKINLNPKISPTTIKEDASALGYYLDKYNQKNFLNIKLNEVKEVTEIDNNYKEIIFEGLGNKYTSIIEEGHLKALKENEEIIGFNKYYYNFASNTVVKKSQTINEEAEKLKNIKLIAENYKKQFDSFANYENSLSNKKKKKGK